MRFACQLTTPRSSEEVFDLLDDPVKFGELFPDCQGVETGNTSCFTVNVGVGNGQLRGTLAFQLDRLEADRPSRLRYIGNGEAAATLISFELTFQIAPNADGTHINCECSVDVDGPVMYFAPQMADSMGARKLEELLTNLQKTLSDSQ
jgi:carbon monoxide dehydrogenase subunit G